MSEAPIGLEARLGQLTGPDANLLGYLQADETNQGWYYLVLRSWPHPDHDHLTTVSLRYAYLTKGDGNDGWTDEGMNMRAEDPRSLIHRIGFMCKSVAEEGWQTSDPWTED